MTMHDNHEKSVWRNILPWLTLTIPALISITELIYSLRADTALSFSPESRGYELLITSAIIFVVEIPITIILLSWIMRTRPLSRWGYIGGLIGPSLPNGYLQTSSISAMPLIVSWIPGFPIGWLDAQTPAAFGSLAGLLYVLVYIGIGFATFRAARTSTKNAALAGVFVAAILLATGALGLISR